MPSKTINNKSPFQLLHKHKPEYLHLKTFGCACYPLLPPFTRHKLQPRTLQCVFFGYPADAKGYKCLNPVTGKLILSRHVIFDETHFPYQQHPTVSSTTSQTIHLNPPVPLLLTPTSISHTPNSTSTIPNPPSQDTAASPPLPQADPYNSTTTTLFPNTQLTSSTTPSSPPPPPITTHPMLTRAKTGSLKPKSIFTLHHTPTSTTAPTSFSQAFKLSVWRTTMSQEFNALQSQGTWDLVPPPTTHTILGSRWTYRLKMHANDTIARHKARLVAQGHKQQPGIDYHETFSPMVKLPTIRVLLTIALHHHWYILQFDVSNAFLHGTLTDTVYMHQPPGFKDSQFPNHVCLLKKAIYGLKQAPRQWFTTFSTHLLSLGFTFSKADPSLLTYHKNSTHLYLLI